MKLIVRSMVLALLLVGVVGVHAASADHKPACRNQGNAGNRANERATYAGSAPDAVAGSSQGQPGSRARMHGCGFNPNSNVDFHLNSTPRFLSNTTTGAAGAFDVELAIPSDAPLGRHTITATGVDASGRAKVESVAFTVVKPAAAGRSAERARAEGELPRTGSNSSTVPMVLGSAALVGLGTVLVIGARRRRAVSA